VVVEAGVPITVVVDGFASPAEAGPYTLTSTYYVADEVEPNDTLESADTSEVPMAAGIYPEGDQDWVEVVLAGSASSLEAEVEGLSNECPLRLLDSEMEILSSDGTRLAFNDDIGQTNYCSRAVASSLDAGTYYVRVSGSEVYAPDATFPYVLQVTVTP